ncbi:MAG: Holliday junction resolvase RuvX [Clostridiales bacterium]|jgi:putative Holliday junction resolvase|nr:Holliday junction resolvase RuvX [Clostridiales bacterium]PWM40052.1 MAG: Holliday junction resolvase RuvX [Clostridiales bacterium]
MKILAVDLGKARTGLAVCDEGEILASPVAVITQYNREKLAQEVAAKARELAVGELVVGLPRNMDGSEGESAQGAREFAAVLGELTGLPVVLRDERLTTVTAHGYLNDTNTRGKKRKAVVDAVAAVVILEEYLSFRRRQRARES